VSLHTHVHGSQPRPDVWLPASSLPAASGKRHKHLQSASRYGFP